MQSNLQSLAPPPRHAAIIMDGNGRWAQERGLPRLAGHRAGAEALRRTVEAAPTLGIRILTLYAFSSDNWRRPRTEVDGLMDLFHEHLREETARCVEHGIRLSVIGRRDRLGPLLSAAIRASEMATRDGTRLWLRLAVDYSARDAILAAAARRNGEEPWSRERFTAALGRVIGGDEPSPDVDLLIRTGGEQRLSDFLLWECAYAELYFTPRFWPDFAEDDLRTAVETFRGRERRFGRLPRAV